MQSCVAIQASHTNILCFSYLPVDQEQPALEAVDVLEHRPLLVGLGVLLGQAHVAVWRVLNGWMRGSGREWLVLE